MDQESKDNNQTLNLVEIREKLAGMKGQAYWRGLEEIAETEEFQQWLGDEFPNRETLLQIDRRDFLKVMGASLALAGVAGCRYLPQEKIVPYVKAPEEVVAGTPLQFASAMSWNGYAKGVLVTSREGRPIKIDGNPSHPATLGSSDIWMQASILDLYDPDRSKDVTHDGGTASYEDFLKEFRAAIGSAATAADASATPVPPVAGSVRILMEATTSPTLAAQLTDLAAKFPSVRIHQFDAAGSHAVRAGANLAFGRDVDTVYHFDKASVVLALDADFLQSMPGSVRYARDWADGRRVRKSKTDMNRLYAAESTPTLTGSNADHRLPLRASDIDAFARALAAELGVQGVSGAAPAGSDAFVKAVAADLKAAGARGLVVPGSNQAASVHAVAHAINGTLGATGSTVTFVEAAHANLEGKPAAAGDPFASLKELAADMNAGSVKAVLILGGNPVFDAPVDVAFAQALAKVPVRAHVSSHVDETSAACTWQVPESHYLEAWGDLRAFDGTASIVQPLIAPLYESHSALEVVSAIAGHPASGYDLVRAYWQKAQSITTADLAKTWEKWLNDGVIAGTAAAPLTVTPSVAALPAPTPTTGIEIIFRPDPNVWDGRYLNNSWLQETPKPVTKLTWDNAILVSPKMAEANHYSNNAIVSVNYKGKELRGPVWITPGHPDGSVTVYFGYGRTKVGKVGGESEGFNAYVIRTSDAPDFGTGAQLTLTNDTHRLVSQQMQQTMEGRAPARMLSIEDYKKRPSSLPGDEHEEEEGGEEKDLFKAPKDHEEWGTEDAAHEYSWGMAIDLNVCIGCNACSVACQSENNIPVVGKEMTAKGRHMNWIRVDRYYEGKSLDNPRILFQPVPCMHCEKAPCEPVCPVAATVHSHEGLNMMIYNRCVGTRYCSNNCPYKVRRFNFYNFANHHETPVLKLLNNPEVTVRGRGVMEKCSYCVQRINRARIEGKIANNSEGAPIKLVGAKDASGKTIDETTPGVLITACQQACPTKAISFGDIRRDNELKRMKEEPANYLLLGELNTKPRTSYLARLSNPNPALASEAGETKAEH